MIEAHTLLLFLLAVLTLLLSPGPNMAFVLSHGFAHGWRGGLAAALGIALADLILTVLTASGITALVAVWPPSFDLLRGAGALYLAWLALQALRKPGQAAIGARSQGSLGAILRRGLLNCLLNPKALLFFMVFLPQFVVAAHGHIALQLTLLGAVLSLTALLFNMVLGAFSGRIGAFLAHRPQASRWQGRVLAGVLLALALRLLLLDRPVTD
jgi:threonine/homoserine/homoserine lactone efflux protein